MGYRWQLLNQFFEGPRGANDRFHLDPMPEQHDVDESGQLPEKHRSLKAECHGAGIDECNGDSDADERHHSGLAAPNLADKSRQEWPAAIALGDRGAPEEHIGVARKAGDPIQSENSPDSR